MKEKLIFLFAFICLGSQCYINNFDKEESCNYTIGTNQDKSEFVRFKSKTASLELTGLKAGEVIKDTGIINSVIIYNYLFIKDIQKGEKDSLVFYFHSDSCQLTINTFSGNKSKLIKVANRKYKIGANFFFIEKYESESGDFINCQTYFYCSEFGVIANRNKDSLKSFETIFVRNECKEKIVEKLMNKIKQDQGFYKACYEGIKQM